MANRLIDLTAAILIVSFLLIVLAGLEHQAKDWWHRRQDNRRLRRAIRWYTARVDLELIAHDTTDTVAILSRPVDQPLNDKVAA